MSRDDPPEIHPNESGNIINQKVPWYLIWYRFQSIAQAGKYTVLSTSKNSKALIFALESFSKTSTQDAYIIDHAA